MDYLDIELLRLEADRAIAQGRPPRSPEPARDGHGLAWLVMVAVLLAIPSTAPWLG